MLTITEKSIGLDGRVFAERRARLRRRAPPGLRARLHMDGGRWLLLGMVLDESGAGARIRFGDICPVPQCFELEIEGRETGRRASVRWRKLTEIGIAYC